MRLGPRAVAILQHLKIAPMHGYELYKILKDKGLAKKTAQTYREIRKLRDLGLVVGDGEMDDRSTGKKPLHLTPAGERVYLDIGKQAFLSLNKLALTGILFKLRRDIWSLVREQQRDFFAKPRRVLIDYAEGSRGEFLRQLGIILKDRMDNLQLFLHEVSKHHIDRIVLERDGIVSVVDANARLVPHDYDVVIAIGVETASLAKARMQEPRTGWLDMLKPDGALLVGMVTERRRLDEEGFEAFLDSSHDAMSTLERRFGLQASEVPRQKSGSTNAEIIQALSSHFPRISIKTLVGGHYDIIMATPA